MYTNLKQGMLGSSPLMRGIHYTQAKILIKYRIIPAHAGNTSSVRAGSFLCMDHPRSCGEYNTPTTVSYNLLGSSPLMRGIPYGAVCLTLTSRIIPAHAGNTEEYEEEEEEEEDHPRSCGEYAIGTSRQYISNGSSPLMRGIHDPLIVTCVILRIIPAHAGNTYVDECGIKQT